jgi:CheY-like chemotaxis protein
MITCGIVSVEDNKTDAFVIKRTLASLTREDVTVLPDGKTAIDYLSDSSNVPRLILLDINLPRYNGLEILSRIRELEHLRETPIIMFSSSQIDEEIRAAYRMGANSYVAKPSSHPELESAIAGIYEYWYKTAKLATCG